MVINGSLDVKGNFHCNSLFLHEELDETIVHYGLTINPFNGYLNYKLPNNILYSYPPESIIDDKISSSISTIQQIIQNVIGNQNASSVVTSTSLPNAIQTSLEYTLSQLYWPIYDETSYKLINMNQDYSQFILPMSYLIDKLYFTQYFDKTFSHNSYQLNTWTDLNLFYNESILKSFRVSVFEKNFVLSNDETSFFSMMTNNFFQSLSATDFSILLDSCVYSDDHFEGYLDTTFSPMFYYFGFGNACINRIYYNSAINNIVNKIKNNSLIYLLNGGFTYYEPETNNQRIKVFFFDFCVFTWLTHYYMLHTIADRYNNPYDYTENIVNYVIQYKNDTDKTSVLDITSLKMYFDVSILYESLLNIHAYHDLLDIIDTSVSVYLQNLKTLNDPIITQLDLQLIKTVKYNNERNIDFLQDIENIKNGQLIIPLYELDIPINSVLFYTL